MSSTPSWSCKQHTIVLLLVIAGVIARNAESLSSYSISFPMKNQDRSSDIVSERLTTAFHEMVDSTQYIHKEFEDTTSHSVGIPAVYRVPAFGDDCRLRFDTAEKLMHASSPNPANPPPRDHFVFQVDGATRDDFGWLCQKLYENRDSFKDDIDIAHLRDEVFSHVNRQPPHPGHNAASTELAHMNVIEDLFNSVTEKSSQDVLDELSKTGFVVLDNTVKTTKEMHENLGNYLNLKTGQSKDIRRDTVAFLEREDAQACGLGSHFNVLMGIASYLNENYDFKASVRSPIAPATVQNPLTNPIGIQAAEYGKGDFYVAHSDNSWAKGQHLVTRNNYRSFTGILYCNDDWEPSDGGALRMYMDSRELAEAKDAPALCHHADILPQNGRLVIFDSTLVHSVEKVHADKFRRALTVWIRQPTDENVQGEVVDVPL